MRWYRTDAPHICGYQPVHRLKLNCMQQANPGPAEPLNVILLEDDDILRDRVLAPNLVRLACGIEAGEDLVADLVQALS